MWIPKGRGNLNESNDFDFDFDFDWDWTDVETSIIHQLEGEFEWWNETRIRDNDDISPYWYNRPGVYNGKHEKIWERGDQEVDLGDFTLMIEWE